MSLPFKNEAPPHSQNLLEQDHCATILGAIVGGWARAKIKCQIDAMWLEVPITECLRDGMRWYVGHIDAKDICVLAGTESRSTPDTLTPDGRTDIPILFTSIREKHNEHDAHAVIECKRVAEDDTHLCHQYVMEGVKRFTRGSRRNPKHPKYAAHHAVAFMAGYLLRGTTGGAVARINSHLDHAEHLGPPSIVRWDRARTSRHPRTKLPAITLHHVFLVIH